MENKNKKWLWAAFALVIAGAALIMAACIAYQITGGNIMSESRSNMIRSWGQAALKNEQQIDAADIESIEIEYRSPDVYLYIGESGKITIKEYIRNKRENAQIITKGGTLRCIGGKSSLSFFTIKTERIEIYLPPEYAGRLQVNISSGNIRTDEDWHMEEFDVTASSGNIYVNSVEADNIKAEASSGNLRFDCVKGRIEMSASSGNIKILSGEVSGSLHVTSGNITASGIVGECRAEASSGNIYLEIDRLLGDAEVSTRSGNMEITLPKDSAFQYQGASNSGDIRTAFDDMLSYNKKGNQAEGTYGDNAKVWIRTEASSGNTKIIFK